MAPDLEKPRIIEIQVRMDCNGCVQKIKKALHGINGICEQYIDFPQQKITIVGWADPEKIVKAIKKTRKTAIICSHIEPPDPPESEAHGDGAAPDSNNPPPGESSNPPPEPATSEPPPVAEPPNNPPPPPPENTKTEPKSPKAAPRVAPVNQPVHPNTPKDVEEVHVIYHHPPEYGYRYPPPPDYGYRYGYGYELPMAQAQGYGPGQWHPYPNRAGPIPEPPSSQRFGGPWHSYQATSGSRMEPSPPSPFYRSSSVETPEPFRTARVETPEPSFHVTHSYNTYRQSPYVTGYEYVSVPPPQYTNFNAPERYIGDYQHYGNSGNGNVTSIFSDENPNSCRIV